MKNSVPVLPRPLWRRILIVNPFGIGDVLFSTPVLAAVRALFPQAYVAFLCQRASEPVLRHNPRLQEIFCYSRGDFRLIRRRSRLSYVRALGRALQTLRQRRFDAVIDLSLARHYSAVCALLGVRQRVGFNYRGRGNFLTTALPLPQGFADRHVVTYYQDLLQAALNAGSAMPARAELFLTAAEHRQARNTLQVQGIPPAAPLLGLIPFGGGSWGQHAAQKQWPAAHYAAVARALIREYNVSIIIFGAAADQPAAAALHRAIDAPRRCLDVSGKTDVRQLFAIVGQCALCIGGDCGPMHAAAALAVPIVSIQGPADERVYGPLGDAARIRIVTADVSCRPCYRDFSVKECCRPRCQSDISPEQVIMAARSLLSSAGCVAVDKKPVISAFGGGEYG